MYNLFEAMLNGVALSLIADEIVVTDIVEDAPRMDTQTVPLALASGMLRTVNRRQSLSVRIRYVIRTQDVVRRSAVQEMVTAWAAGGGTLMVNTRPEKQLQVVCDTVPAQGSGMKWTDEIEIVLTAYGSPYWEDISPRSIGVSTAWNAARGEYYFVGALKPNGNTQTIPLECAMECGGDTVLDQLEISCGDTFIKLEGIEAKAGDVISVLYDKNGVLQINKANTAGNVSLLPMRTPASSDDLLATPGVQN